MWQLPPPDAIGGVFLAGAVGRNKWGWSNFIHCLLYGSAPDLELGAKPTGISGNALAEKTGHPTTKPLRWIEWAVSLASREVELIFDPFLGSGTTAVAAKKLGRHFLGFEISPDYCKIAEERIALVEAQPNLFQPKAKQLSLGKE
jgi:DNA modification methylase